MTTTDDVPMPVIEDFWLTTSNIEHLDATTPVRWCLSAEARAKLVTDGAVRPMMVLITAHNRGTEEYPLWTKDNMYIVPLEAELTYVTFRAKGDNKLFAAICWHTEGELKTLRKEAHRDTYLIDRHSGRLSPKAFRSSENDITRLEFVAEHTFIVPDDPGPPEIRVTARPASA